MQRKFNIVITLAAVLLAAIFILGFAGCEGSVPEWTYLTIPASHSDNAGNIPETATCVQHLHERKPQTIYEGISVAVSYQAIVNVYRWTDTSGVEQEASIIDETAIRFKVEILVNKNRDEKTARAYDIEKVSVDEVPRL